MEISALHPFIVKPDGTFHVMLKEPPEKKTTFGKTQMSLLKRKKNPQPLS